MTLLDGQNVEWIVSSTPVGYEEAVRFMETRVDDIFHRRATELVWLLEHTPLYTAGTSADPADLIAPDRFPVHQTGRGGQFTYHGPGQRIAYVMLDLNARGRDVRAYVNALQDWIIATLSEFGVEGECRSGRPGVWVRRKDASGEDKIAAVGVRVRRWVTFHGVSINVDPDLAHYDGIVPCGIREYGVTSMHALGVGCSISDLDQALKRAFEKDFGPANDPAALDLVGLAQNS